MKAISELKKELTFNKEMNELMNILRQTATIEFKSLFARRKTMTIAEKYVALLESLFKIGALKQNRHPLFLNPLNKVLLILVTSDMGFLGGLNTEIIETGLRQIGRRDELHVLVIGDKGYNYLEDLSQSFDYLGGISEEVKFSEAEKIRDYIYAFTLKNNIGRVIIGYPRFISFARQEIDMFGLLPCGHLFESAQPEEEPESGSVPAAAGPARQQSSLKVQYIFEPFRDRVVDYLVRTWLVLRIHDIFWHSKLSELAARALHLDASIDELKDMKRSIQQQYFRSKHEIADRTIRDVFGGRRAILKAANKL
jgi:F-type H+-transporting ATPase subunit gamma